MTPKPKASRERRKHGSAKVVSLVDKAFGLDNPFPEGDRWNMIWETNSRYAAEEIQGFIAAQLALPLFSEVGRDMSKWPTAAHFVSWLALCPDNDISGGKLLWRGVRTVKNRAGHLFRLAAFSLHHSPTLLGNYLRRMKAKLGPRAATTATAHKIAVIFYTMVKKQVEYDESIWATRDAHRQQRFEMKLKRQAKQLGYQLVPIEPKAA